MQRGGKRERAGRKAQGITRKVSLTLMAEEWAEIDQEPIAAAYIRNLQEEVRALLTEKIWILKKVIRNKETQLEIMKEVNRINEPLYRECGWAGVCVLSLLIGID